MSKQHNIESLVLSKISTILYGEKVSKEQTFEQIDMDSLDMTNLIMQLEELLGINYNEKTEGLSRTTTIEEFIAKIDRLVSAKETNEKSED